ncbi:MAG: glycoside hydrolase family 15 protein [Bacteroidota bacterium]
MLQTDFKSASGSFRLTDFAPRFFQNDRFYKPLMLVRKIEVLSGAPEVRIVCRPVGGYGSVSPSIMYGSNSIRYEGLADPVRLTTNVPLNYIVSEQKFVLTDAMWLCFTYGVPLEGPIESTLEDFYKRTLVYWRRWVRATSIASVYQRNIIRSALVLKLHQYEDTGGIIASGTASLSEFDGSTRNWDYRYCWMRDAYYTLNAFNSVGHFEELEQYFKYILNVITAETKRAQPLYSITGESNIEELILDLPGYRGNQPVRIGNQASEHVQNDVYGQVLTSLLPVYVDARLNYGEPNKYKQLVHWLVDKIEMTMDEPDAGIWEFRGREQYHAYTYLFHWAGSKAACKIADYYGDRKLKKQALKLVRLSSEKLEACYDPVQKAYTQAIGVKHLDAACLQLITMNYLDPRSQRAKDHLAALERELKAEGGLFYRYLHSDDFGKPHATFLVCGFWYVEALACTGRINQAVKHFEELLKYSNHLGLFSEDVESGNGSQWGNFPQTYSHVGLMNAAYRISRKLDLPVFL